MRDATKVKRDEDERDVMVAFGQRHSMCIHMLHEMTAISYEDLQVALVALQKRGRIQRVPEKALGDNDKQYMRVGHLLPEHFRGGLVMSPLIGLSELDIRGRVALLKNMKARLICEWHPVIDTVLRDYERDLKRVEAARTPPCADTTPVRLHTKVLADGRVIPLGD